MPTEINQELKTIQDVLRFAATTAHGVTLIEGEQKENYIAYADLQTRALGVLHYLQSAGIKAGDELIILLPAGEQFLDMFWGAIAGGIIPVPLAVGISDEHKAKVFNVWEKLNNPWLITDMANFNRLEAFANSREELNWFALRDRCLQTDRIGALTEVGVPHPARPEDIAFIQFSSGSTGSPKGVTITHQNLIANIEGMRSQTGLGADDVLLNWMPLTHDMGLIGLHMMPMHAGIPNYIIPTEVFIRRPLLWLLKASEHGATFLGSPNFGYKHFLNAFSPEKLQGTDLRKVRVIFNGAEPVSSAICTRFLTSLAPYGLREESMYPVYGLAEATLAVTIPPQTALFSSYFFDRDHLGAGDEVVEVPASQERAVDFTGLGQAIPQISLKIGNEQGEAVPDGVVGYVYISGASVTSGYYNDADKTKEAFVEGWFNTGDLGVIWQGELVVTGRAKDIIFLNGQNYYPHDLERIAEGIEKVELGKVAAAGLHNPDTGSDQVLVFVVHKGKPAAFLPTARQVKTLITEQTGLEVHEVVPVRQLPKTTSGKVQRYKLVHAFMEGEFEAAVAELHAEAASEGLASGQSATELEIKILGIANAVFRDTQIGPEDNLFEVGTSSLILAQIHEQVDEEWPDQIDITDYFDYPSVRTLATYLEQKLAG